MVNEGQLAPIDIVAADAQVSAFEQTLYTALEDVSRAENGLKMLIAQNKNAAIWTSSIVPSDSVDLTPPDITLPDAMKLAMENRPELQQSNLAREFNDIDQQYYRDQKRAQVDLVGSYGMTGLSGTPVTAINPFTASTLQLRDRVNDLSVLSGIEPLPVLPTQSLSPFLTNGLGQSFSNLLLNRFNHFRVGVSVSLPIKNRTAEAQLGR